MKNDQNETRAYDPVKGAKVDLGRLSASQRLVTALVAFALTTIIVGPVGGFLGYILSPRRAEPEKIFIQEKPLANDKEIEAKIRKLAEEMAVFIATGLVVEKMPAYLEENWLGLMEIKDGQATRAPSRQAGIRGKNGIIGFPKNTTFQVHGYVVENKNGAGLASTIIDGNRYYISFYWLAGSTHAPPRLKEFRVQQGKKIVVVRSE